MAQSDTESHYLSMDGVIYKQLIRHHVACYLREHNVDVPTNIAVIGDPLLCIRERPPVYYGAIEPVFEKVVKEFRTTKIADLQSNVDGLTDGQPVNANRIKCILYSVLDGDHVHYGDLITITVFLAMIAQKCCEHGQLAMIDDLIDCAVYLAANNLSDYFHEHGGWAIYAPTLKDETVKVTTTQSSESWSLLGFIAVSTMCMIL